MPHTYILLSEVELKTYVGSTVDLKKRITEHNAGKSSFTRKYRPWKLVYSEEFNNIKEARRREKYFKTSAGRSFMKKIIPR